MGGEEGEDERGCTILPLHYWVTGGCFPCKGFRGKCISVFLFLYLQSKQEMPFPSLYASVSLDIALNPLDSPEKPI